MIFCSSASVVSQIVCDPTPGLMSSHQYKKQLIDLMPPSANLFLHMPTLFGGILSLFAITFFSRPSADNKTILERSDNLMEKEWPDRPAKKAG
jgi:hypothetical protein